MEPFCQKPASHLAAARLKVKNQWFDLAFFFFSQKTPSEGQLLFFWNCKPASLYASHAGDPLLFPHCPAPHNTDSLCHSRYTETQRHSACCCPAGYQVLVPCVRVPATSSFKQNHECWATHGKLQVVTRGLLLAGKQGAVSSTQTSTSSSEHSEGHRSLQSYSQVKLLGNSSECCNMFYRLINYDHFWNAHQPWPPLQIFTLSLACVRTGWEYREFLYG